MVEVEVEVGVDVSFTVIGFIVDPPIGVGEDLSVSGVGVGVGDLCCVLYQSQANQAPNINNITTTIPMVYGVKIEDNPHPDESAEGVAGLFPGICDEGTLLNWFMSLVIFWVMSISIK
jgi:hypothetical protein